MVFMSHCYQSKHRLVRESLSGKISSKRLKRHWNWKQRLFLMTYIKSKRFCFFISNSSIWLSSGYPTTYEYSRQVVHVELFISLSFLLFFCYESGSDNKADAAAYTHMSTRKWMSVHLHAHVYTHMHKQKRYRTRTCTRVHAHAVDMHADALACTLILRSRPGSVSNVPAHWLLAKDV